MVSLKRYLLLTIFLIASLSLVSKAETLKVNPKFVNFGEIEIGNTKKAVITIKNPTDESIKIDKMELSNDVNFFLAVWGGNKPCKGNKWLKPQEECTVVIRFTPFKEKKYEEEFTIKTKGGDEITVDLEGKGVNLSPDKPRIVIRPSKREGEEYNFGKVFANDRAVEVFLISNKGKHNLVFTKPIRVSDDDHFEVNPYGGNRPCNSYQPVLRKNRTCTIEVYFYPTKDKKYSTDLKLNTNDPDNKEIKIKLLGKGTYKAEPDIEIVKSKDNFPDEKIDKQAKLQISIYNYGNTMLEINEIKLKKEDDIFKLDLKGGKRPCSTEMPSIEPHDYCTVYVRFKPKEEKKYKTELIIKSNDPDDDEIKITLKGKGIKKKDIMDLNLKDEFTNGCSFGSVPSIPFYLFIPFIILIRKIRNRIYS